MASWAGDVWGVGGGGLGVGQLHADGVVRCLENHGWNSVRVRLTGFGQGLFVVFVFCLVCSRFGRFDLLPSSFSFVSDVRFRLARFEAFMLFFEAVLPGGDAAGSRSFLVREPRNSSGGVAASREASCLLRLLGRKLRMLKLKTDSGRGFFISGVQSAAGHHQRKVYRCS